MEAGKFRKKQKSRLLLLFNDMILWCATIENKNTKTRRKEHDGSPSLKYKYKGHFMIRNDAKFHFGQNISTGPNSKTSNGSSNSKHHSKSGTYQSRRTKLMRNHSDPFVLDDNDTIHQGFWFGNGATSRHAYCSKGKLDTTI